jgi:hypothetical protein
MYFQAFSKRKAKFTLSGMSKSSLGFYLFLICLISTTPRADAQLSGNVNFVVLKVTFSDFGTATRFTEAQTQTDFGNVATLWGNDTSYGNITLNYQFAGPYQVASPSTTYLDAGGGNSSSTSAIVQLIDDAVSASPNTISWNNVYGVVVLFADTRASGFYRGITLPSTVSISPPGGGTFQVHGSIVGENPSQDVPAAWGRWGHEMGHQMQANPGKPWHPSNYNSDFEEMDAEYPSQSGMFNKQANMAYPGWMPPGKYKAVSPPLGGEVGLLAEERAPGTQPDFQAIKASLTFGGPQLYYLVSVRHHILGDDLATTHGPSGIPDEGVLIERVVEGGDPNVLDSGLARWVVVEGNGGSDNLWHLGDAYKSAADGIFITVRANPDSDHYVVDVSYADKSGQPDVGMNSWLQPPGNTYETTDIWIDSPVNGFGVFRYPLWSDLMGGTVPSGNGDDPAVNQVNRIYARVRNFGSLPATNIVVHFDVTNPLGVGINGSNGFVQLGTVDKSLFPALALLQPGKSTDVYLEWTPNVTLTPQEIQEGQFFFHSCVRVRIDHVPGETFFANQDGDGQQENILYFDAGSPASPGAPGASSKTVIHLRNDSPAMAKEFFLSVEREHLPITWKVELNNGKPVVKLGPGQMKDVPVTITQTAHEPVGSRHTIQVFASSRATLKNESRPNDFHDEFETLGGVQFQVAVLRHPKIKCECQDGIVTGTITGLDPRDSELQKKHELNVFVSAINSEDQFIPEKGVLAPVVDGRFRVRAPEGAKRVIGLFSGTAFSSSAASPICIVR